MYPPSPKLPPLQLPQHFEDSAYIVRVSASLLSILDIAWGIRRLIPELPNYPFLILHPQVIHKIPSQVCESAFALEVYLYHFFLESAYMMS